MVGLWHGVWVHSFDWGSVYKEGWYGGLGAKTRYGLEHSGQQKKTETTVRLDSVRFDSIGSQKRKKAKVSSTRETWDGDLFKSEPMPNEPVWAGQLQNATLSTANLFGKCGRLEKAAAAVEECLRMERAYRMQPDGVAPTARTLLTWVYIQMGKYEKAVAVGL